MKSIGWIEKLEDGIVIHREKVEGFCKEAFKDTEAYERLTEPCYLPDGEERNGAYTGQDFIDLCNGQKEIADIIFEAISWQQPETVYMERDVRRGMPGWQGI